MGSPVKGTKDIFAIAALIGRYANCIDCGDLDGLADLFAAGAIRTPRLEAVGPAEVRRAYEGVILDEHGLPGTHHHVFDIEIDVEGDRATAESFVTVIQDGNPIIAGRHRDRFVRDTRGWHFEERCPYLDIVGDLSGHVPALAAALAQPRWQQGVG